MLLVCVGGSDCVEIPHSMFSLENNCHINKSLNVRKYQQLQHSFVSLFLIHLPLVLLKCHYINAQFQYFKSSPHNEQLQYDHLFNLTQHCLHVNSYRILLRINISNARRVSCFSKSCSSGPLGSEEDKENLCWRLF